MTVIDGDALIALFKTVTWMNLADASAAIHLTHHAPTIDAVEVVRCIDCIHLESNREYTRFWCERGQFGCRDVFLDDYCSWGERGFKSEID